MRRYYFRSMLLSLGFTIIASISLIWLHSIDVGLAVSTGVIGSMFVMAVSNMMSWMSSIYFEMNELKERYVIMIDQIGDLYQLIYNAKRIQVTENRIPGVKATIMKYNAFYHHIQSLHNDYLKKKFHDYYKLQNLIEKICIDCKKLNNQFSIFQTDEQSFEVYSNVSKYIEESREINVLSEKLIKLQNSGIISTDERAMKH